MPDLDRLETELLGLQRVAVVAALVERMDELSLTNPTPEELDRAQLAVQFVLESYDRAVWRVVDAFHAREGEGGP